MDLKDRAEMELKKMAIRDNMKAENDAIMMYSKYIDLLPAGDPVRKGLEDIRDEEKEHAGELHQLLVTLDPEELYDFNEGIGEVKREQGIKDAGRKKGAGRKAASFDWQKENAIPGAWSAKVSDGEYIVLPPEETGFDGYVVYWSSDGYALDDAVGGDLLSPDTFNTADEAKKAAEGWQKSAQSGANDAIEDYFEDTEYDRVGASRKVANGWSTDGITCTLEEDNVKLFVEPELDKWRWDVNVDGELFDTGLADSMPEAQICAEDCAEDAIGHSFIAEKEGRVAKRRRKSADSYDSDLDEMRDMLEDEIEHGGRFTSEDEVKYFIQDIFQQEAFEDGFDNDEWTYKTDYVVNNLDLGRYVTGKVARRSRKTASLLLDWQDMGGGQYVAKGDLCDGVVFDDGGSWSWRLYEPKWDKFDDTYGYYGDGFGSKDEAMDELERSLNALRRMFGSSSSKVDEVYNEKWYG